MTDSAPPSRNPTNDDTMVGVFAVVLQKFLQGEVDDMLPAIVLAYDRSTNMAMVQPLIVIVTTLNVEIQRDAISSVPVIQLGGGGFMQNFPVKASDLGFIKASDRDISLFKQTWQQSPPNTARMHNFSDGVFVPTVLTGFVIADEDLQNAVFQNLAGTVRISLWPSQIKITAPNTGIGDTDGYTADPNAVLDVQSTTRALKIPRMTHGQRDAIASPQGGFMVYVTDAPTGFSFYTDGTGWS